MRRLLGLTLLALTALPALATDLTVSEPRTAPPLPGTDMMAGYLTLTNEQSAPVTVTGATSDEFGRVSLHRSIEEDGQSRMEPVESLTVEPGSSVAFAPGGRHLMLHEPAGDPELGDTVRVSLQTDHGRVDVDLHVVARSELLRR